MQLTLYCFFQVDWSRNIHTSLAPVRHVAENLSSAFPQSATESLDKQVLKIHTEQIFVLHNALFFLICVVLFECNCYECTGCLLSILTDLLKLI